MKIDEASQVQLDYFAHSFRRAMAARTTIVVCAGPNHEAKCEEIGVGVASPAVPGESNEKSMEIPITLLLVITNAMIQESTKGRCKVMVSTPDGTFDVPSNPKDESTFRF